MKRQRNSQSALLDDRKHGLCVRGTLVAALLTAAPGLVPAARAATVGPSDQWSGTVGVRIDVPLSQVPESTMTAQGSCTLSIRLNGAVATESTTMTVTDTRQNTPQANQTTTTTVEPAPAAGTQTVPVNTGGTRPVLVNPNPNFNNADYRLLFYLPSLSVIVNSQASDSASAPLPNSGSSYRTMASCSSSSFLNLLGGFGLAFPTEPPHVDLSGPLIIQGTAKGDGTNISGSVKGSVTDPGNNNGILPSSTVTVAWNLRDISAQKPTLPTGKIKVTNDGIEATLDYKGWEISYSGDWKASQKQANTAPKISSPDQKVTITFQEQPANGQPSAAATRATISQTANAVGHVSAISYKPFSIGALKGQIGVVTFANAPDALLIAVVSDGQHQVITQTLVTPNTPPADLLEAGIALGSIHQAGSAG